MIPLPSHPAFGRFMHYWLRSMVGVLDWEIAKRLIELGRAFNERGVA